MREITIGGHKYMIHCSVITEAAINKRRDEILQRAEDEASDDVGGLSESETLELIRKRKVSALRDASYNAGESLNILADMINTAVDYENVVNARDIRPQVFGGYPMTAQKLALVVGVTADDLNRIAEPVAQELIEEQGGDAKNLKAGTVLMTTRRIMRAIRSTARSTGPGSNTAHAD